MIIISEQDSKYAELIDGIRIIAEKIIDCVQKYLYISLRIGIGGLKEHWYQISDSLEEAFYFLTQEAYIIPTSNLYEYCDSTNKRPYKKDILAKPMKFYHQLMKILKIRRAKTGTIIHTYISEVSAMLPNTFRTSASVTSHAQFLFRRNSARAWPGLWRTCSIAPV